MIGADNYKAANLDTHGLDASRQGSGQSAVNGDYQFRLSQGQTAAAQAAYAGGLRPYQPPVIYDITTDSWRAATQADVDQLVALVNHMNLMRREIAKLHDLVPPQPNQTS